MTRSGKGRNRAGPLAEAWGRSEEPQPGLGVNFYIEEKEIAGVDSEVSYQFFSQTRTIG